jgi:hypothetical protein
MRTLTIATMAAGLAATAFAGSAGAVTFADYGAASSDANLTWTQSSNTLSGALSTTGVSGGAQTVFSFLTPTLSSLSNLPALFTLTATAPASDPAVSGVGQIAEQNLSGSFSFIYDGTTTLTVGSKTFAPGANLLSGTFAGATLVGPANGSTSSFQDAIFSGGTVSFSSDLASFSPTGDKGLSLALTSVLPFFGVTTPGTALNSFSAVSTGSFAADLAGGGGAGGVPEPVTWAIMLLGFGGVGASLRRERHRAARSAA